MTPEQAIQELQTIVNAAQLAELSLRDHKKWQDAALALQEFINPQKPEKTDA